MKPQYQKIHDDKIGDCYRACIASILEFDAEEMPNFWEQTQDPIEFMRMNNNWLSDNKNCKIVTLIHDDELEFYFKDLLCIAIMEVNKIEHAVVWKNRIIFDPNKFNNSTSYDYSKPNHYSLLVPNDISKVIK